MNSTDLYTCLGRIAGLIECLEEDRNFKTAEEHKVVNETYIDALSDLQEILRQYICTNDIDNRVVRSTREYALDKALNEKP